MLKYCLKFFLFFFFLAIFFQSAQALVLAGAHLELSPSSGLISGSGTPVDINIDTDGSAAKSAKAVINFDSSLLEIASIEEGDFFDDVSYNIYNSSGQVVVNANLSLDSMLESKTGSGLLGTMTVKALESSGSASMTFDCTEGSSTDSNINDPTPVDIIVCTENVDGDYSLSRSGASSSPSSSPGAIASPNPSPVSGGGVGGGGTQPPIPVTGMAWPTLVLFFGGLALILTPLLAKIRSND
jgi:hypothetical protein